jgi:hypothetical protein
MGLYFALYLSFTAGPPSVLDDAVRAMALSLDFIEASTKMFMHIEPFCEFSNFGVLLPQNFRVIPYFPNFNEGKTFDAKINIIFGFIAIFIITVVAYNIFASAKGGLNYKYLMTFTGLLNSIIMILMLIHIAQINSHNSLQLTTDAVLTQVDIENDIVIHNIFID